MLPTPPKAASTGRVTTAAERSALHVSIVTSAILLPGPPTPGCRRPAVRMINEAMMNTTTSESILSGAHIALRRRRARPGPRLAGSPCPTAPVRLPITIVKGTTTITIVSGVSFLARRELLVLANSGKNYSTAPLAFEY